jgi:hypothetical protein
MPIIRANSGVITQINLFTVPEGGEQSLIDLLRESFPGKRQAGSPPAFTKAAMGRGSSTTHRARASRRHER